METYGRTYVRTDVRTDEIWKASCRPAPLGSGKKSHGKGTDTQTHIRTLRLYDRIGPVGRFDENYYVPFIINIKFLVFKALMYKKGLLITCEIHGIGKVTRKYQKKLQESKRNIPRKYQTSTI